MDGGCTTPSPTATRPPTPTRWRGGAWPPTDAPPPEPLPPAPLLGATDFERRHAERFKGRQFDWLNFQADGQPYPVPNRADPWRYPVQEMDERVPYSEAEQMFVALKKNGVPAQMIQYAGMYHGITGSWNQVHRMLSERGWLDRWVRPGPGTPVLK